MAPLPSAVSTNRPSAPVWVSARRLGASWASAHTATVEPTTGAPPPRTWPWISAANTGAPDSGPLAGNAPSHGGTYARALRLLCTITMQLGMSGAAPDSSGERHRPLSGTSSLLIGTSMPRAGVDPRAFGSRRLGIASGSLRIRLITLAAAGFQA